MVSRYLQGCDSRPSHAPQHLGLFPPVPPQSRPPYTWPSQYPFGVLSPSLTPEFPHRCTKTQSEHVESGPYGYYPQSTNDTARRGVMSPVPSTSAASTSTRPMHITLPTQGPTTAFTFAISPHPEMHISFPSRPAPLQQSKRRRATADVDGEHSCLQKKKRRLRLFLITSRLSPQFSHPATNIVDRGSSKIAVWAKQRASGRNILRKAAILNRIRRQSLSALEIAGGRGRVLVGQEKEQEQLQLARLTLMYGSHDSATRPPSEFVGLPQVVVETRTGDQVHSRSSSPASSSGSPEPELELRACDEEGAQEYRSPNDAYTYSHAYPKSPRASHLPLSPSPLGLSNYDALDLEDDIPDPYAHLDEEYDAEEQVDHMVDEDASPPRPSFQRKSSSEPLDMSSRQVYSDFSILDHDQPVMGDYDRVEDGADAIWPMVRLTYDDEIDAELPSCSSPNSSVLFATASTAGMSRSPNFVPAPVGASLSPASSLPNFSPLYTTTREPMIARRQSDGIEEEKERQRGFMFMSFGS